MTSTEFTGSISLLALTVNYVKKDRYAQTQRYTVKHIISLPQFMFFIYDARNVD